MQTPTYVRIADDLAGAIHTSRGLGPCGPLSERRLVPGVRMPTEPQLMDLYGVARETIRDALGVLEARGLVGTRPGRKGRYVLELVPIVVEADSQRPQRVGTIAAWRAAVEATNREYLTDFACDLVGAPAEIAGLLCLKPNTRVMQRVLNRYADETPLSQQRTWIPLWIAKAAGIGNQQIEDGTAAQLARAGYIERRWLDDMIARPPTTDEMQRYGLRGVGVPIIEITRTAIGDDGPICVVRDYVLADRHRLRTVIRL